MKILGIGNAIVDVLCKVDDEFLKKYSLTKSTMKLIDEIEFKNLISEVKIEETISGGSVANSIVGLSQLGNDVGFIGKVKNDDLGKKKRRTAVLAGAARRGCGGWERKLLTMDALSIQCNTNFHLF